MSGLNKYNEISETIKSDIFNGRLKENKALPSIRRLAQYYNVNPATIVRALNVLSVYYDENVPLFRKNGYRKSGTMILRVRSRDTALN